MRQLLRRPLLRPLHIIRPPLPPRRPKLQRQKRRAVRENRQLLELDAPPHKHRGYGNRLLSQAVPREETLQNHSLPAVLAFRFR